MNIKNTGLNDSFRNLYVQEALIKLRDISMCEVDTYSKNNYDAISLVVDDLKTHNVSIFLGPTPTGNGKPISPGLYCHTYVGLDYIKQDRISQVENEYKDHSSIQEAVDYLKLMLDIDKINNCHRDLVLQMNSPYRQFIDHLKTGGRVWYNDPDNRDHSEWLNLTRLDGHLKNIEQFAIGNLSLKGPELVLEDRFYDDDGFEHILVSHTNTEIVTRRSGQFCIWDRKSGDCLKVGLEGTYLSNYAPTAREVARSQAAGLAAIREMESPSPISDRDLTYRSRRTY